eukprot:963706-Rhodomonas_salina.3
MRTTIGGSYPPLSSFPAGVTTIVSTAPAIIRVSTTTIVARKMSPLKRTPPHNNAGAEQTTP